MIQLFSFPLGSAVLNWRIYVEEKCMKLSLLTGGLVVRRWMEWRGKLNQSDKAQGLRGRLKYESLGKCLLEPGLVILNK